jgi:uncharacterized protein YcbK (DUF882 family)
MVMLRRSFCGALLLAMMPGAFAGNGFKDLHADRLDRDRCLQLYRPQSNERVSFCYWKKESGFQRDGYLKAVHILRDVEYGKTHYIDPHLLDVLFLIQSWLIQEGRASEIQILSGYRTPAHNFRLEGAAKQSLHMQGMAADIYIPGLATKVLALMSRYVGAGGVGIYLDKNFIHLDTGRVRQWRG